MFAGKVVWGDSIGKELGYPTANLDVQKRDIKLAAGIYAAQASLNKKKYQAALAIQEEPWKVEVYLFNYQGDDFYEAYLEVEALQKVSEMEKMDSTEELKEKIAKDIAMVKDIFTD